MSDVKLVIDADAKPFEAGMKRAQTAAKEGAEHIKTSLESMSSAFSKINGAMVAFAGILAGGEAFKEAVQASAGAAYAAIELGRQLGITATQASILKVAMDENFVSSEAVTTASSKIAMTLKTNAHAFAALGVATRDSNGNFRNSFDIMTDVNAKLASFKEGTDRNVEGQKIYGRSWASVMDSIRITGTAMEEAKEKADALGLTVGQRGVKQALDYKTAMAGVHTVFDAIEKAIGDALVPVLTQLGNWFSSVGPQAVQLTKSAIVQLVAAFETLNAIGKTVVESLMTLFQTLIGSLKMIFEVFEGFITKGPSGAKAAWDRNFKEIEDAAKQRVANIKNAWKDAQDTVDGLGDRLSSKDTPIAPQKNGAASSGGDGREHSQMSAFEAQLTAKKAALQAEQQADGQYREFSKQQELEYWQSILATNRVSAADKIAILKKIQTDTQAIQKASFERELAGLKTEESEHKNNMTARLAIEEEYASKVKAAYGADSKEFDAAQKTILATKREAVAQQRQIDDIRATSARTVALDDVQSEADAAKLKFQNGQISLNQYVEMERQFENRKLAIREQALQQQLALAAQDPDASPVKIAQIHAQIEALQTQHQAALFRIDQQASAQQAAIYRNLTDTMARGFSNAFQGIIQGTETMGQAMRRVFSQMLGTILNFFTQWAAKALITHILAMAQNKQEAASNSAVAATGAAKSAADIPYVGWALAIGAAASVFAAASSYSAAGGFDVPSGINPMTQLHSREMVLPANLADNVRRMSGEGNSRDQSGGGEVHVHLNGQRAGGLFTAHEDDLVAAIKSAHSRFKLS